MTGGIFIRTVYTLTRQRADLVFEMVPGVGYDPTTFAL